MCIPCVHFFDYVAVVLSNILPLQRIIATDYRPTFDERVELFMPTINKNKTRLHSH